MIWTENLALSSRQYDRLNAVFGYDLRVEPIQGTDQLRCTFTTLTDPIDEPANKWDLGLRKKDIPVVAFPDDLSPFVIKSAMQSRSRGFRSVPARLPWSNIFA
jgi:hypothetical protein